MGWARWHYNMQTQLAVQLAVCVSLVRDPDAQVFLIFRCFQFRAFDVSIACHAGKCSLGGSPQSRAVPKGFLKLPGV